MAMIRSSSVPVPSPVGMPGSLMMLTLPNSAAVAPGIVGANHCNAPMPSTTARWRIHETLRGCMSSTGFPVPPAASTARITPSMVGYASISVGVASV
jgi:hypothetical protein